MRASKRRMHSEDSGLFKKIFKPLANVFSVIVRWLKDFFYGISVAIHNFFRNLFGTKEKGASMSTKRRKELIFFICLVAYPMLQFLVFYVGVNINSVLLAFQKFDLDTSTFEFLTGNELFKNFSDFIDSFVDKKVSDVTIDANANASNKDITRPTLKNPPLDAYKIHHPAESIITGVKNQRRRPLFTSDFRRRDPLYDCLKQFGNTFTGFS